MLFLSDVPDYHDDDDEEYDDDDDDDDEEYDDDDDDDDDVEGMLDQVPGIVLESPGGYLRSLHAAFFKHGASTADPDDFDDEYTPADDAPWNVIRTIRLYDELSPESLEEENGYSLGWHDTEVTPNGVVHYTDAVSKYPAEMTDFTKEHVYKLQVMINDVNAYMERQDTQTRAYIANMKYGLVAP